MKIKPHQPESPDPDTDKPSVENVASENSMAPDSAPEPTAPATDNDNLATQTTPPMATTDTPPKPSTPAANEQAATGKTGTGETDTGKTTTGKTPAGKTRKGRITTALALLALLLTLIAIAGCIYLYYQVYTQNIKATEQATQQKNRIDELDIRPQLKALQQDLDAITEQSKQRAAGTGIRIDKLQDAVQVLQETGSRSDRAWVIAETRYLLKMAQHRLLLAADLDSAAAASSAADAQLHSLADVSLLPVREALAEEIAQLRSAPRPDIEGVVLSLIQLARRGNSLALYTTQAAKADTKGEAGPVETEQTPASQTETDTPAEIDTGNPGIGNEIKQSIKAFLKQHVVIKPAPDTSLPLENPALDETQILGKRAALQLALQRAQIAALRRDQVDFLSAVQAAQALLSEHFDLDKPRVQRFAEDLDTVARASVRPIVEGIGEALKRLNKIEAGLGGQS